MTTEPNKDSLSLTASDDQLFDVDLGEVDDLINSATQLLDEVFKNRPMPAPIPEALTPREDAMQQVRMFLNSIRDPETPQDDDVVFVEARPGNALPSNARTTAIVDLCTPGCDEPEPVRPTNTTTPRRRGRRGAGLVPQSLFTNNTPSSRRRRPKKEPGTTSTVKLENPVVTLEDSPAPGAAGGSLPSLTCAVCMESVINRQPSSTSCGHIFCLTCIMQAIRLTKKCPLCNSKLKPNQVHRVYF